MLIYPAIFHRTIEGGYIVVFPDFDDGATEGQTLEQAMEMAEDYIGTYLYDDFIKGKDLPKASNINKISIISLKICSLAKSGNWSGVKYNIGFV